MPLPQGGKQTWPPTPGAITTKYCEWSAWLSGDPDQLGAVYGNTVGNSRTGRAFFTGTGEHPNHRSQYSGGITGIVARLFWGQPVPLGEKRTKLHVPLAGDLAATSSAQLFSKPPTFTAESAKTQQVLDGFLDDGMHATLLEAGEVCSAISGVYLRVAWDKAIADASWTNVVRPDCAVPEWTYGKLTAVTFWRVIHDEGSKVVRHLERHDFATATIEHGVYEGDQTELGRPVPLEDYPATAPLAKLVTDGGLIVLPKGCPPLVQYVPNMRPNRIWPDISEAAQLGRSDYSGQETLLDALDETYCADEETEILTDHGWVGYQDLREGDTVLTLNHETGLSEWGAVQQVNVFPAQEREMLSIESRSHSSLTTLNHRWPVLRPHYRNGKGAIEAGTYKQVAGRDRAWATSEALHWEDCVPIAADCADLPEEPKYTDALVESVAWFWTEGHIRKLRDGRAGRNVTICQATKAADHCDRIRSALTRAFGAAVEQFPRMGKSGTDGTPRWREWATGRNAVFALNADAGELVQSLAPGRVPSYAFLRSLTKAQLELFIEVSMMADNSGKSSLAQKDPAAAEAFQFACILAGHATSIRPNVYASHDRSGNEYHMLNVNLRSARVFYPKKGRAGHGKPTRVTYSGKVWCPTTENGTWLARRRGTVYFTGNSGWMRDVRLAKGRLIVPRDYMQNLGKGEGAVFDSDQEVFVPIKSALGDGAGDAITINQFAIRVDEHQRTAQDLVEQIIRGAGLSAQTFGEYQGQAITATEVNSKERQTLTTRGRKINYWRPGLADHVHARLFIDKAVFGAQLTPERPEITFPDTVQPDPLTQSNTALNLYNARAASTETLVRMVNPTWDDKQINAEVAKIMAEAPQPAQPPALNVPPEPLPAAR